jgi:hypothetical protein
MSTVTVNPRRKATTRTLSLTAVIREQNRRAKPKAERGKTASWVFSALDNTQLGVLAEGLAAGRVVSITFGSGRVEHIGPKVTEAAA